MARGWSELKIEIRHHDWYFYGSSTVVSQLLLLDGEIWWHLETVSREEWGCEGAALESGPGEMAKDFVPPRCWAGWAHLEQVGVIQPGKREGTEPTVLGG